MSRVSVDTGYLFGIAVPMIVFGVGQGLGLSSLTTGGMAGVQPRDAAVAGGLVNVAHHLGGALGLGILVTVFDAAGSRGDGPQALLADRVLGRPHRRLPVPRAGPRRDPGNTHPHACRRARARPVASHRRPAIRGGAPQRPRRRLTPSTNPEPAKDPHHADHPQQRPEDHEGSR